MQYEAAASYEDTIRIATPEGVELELELAGVGSRLTARLIDTAIQAALIGAALFVFLGSFDDSSVSGAVGVIVAVLIGFAIFWGYDTLFEAFNGGQTPGKRWNSLRVIGERGEPVSFRMAAVRNILRLVDEALTLFIAALVSILRSPRNQRLGDIAAGTLVVRERPSVDADAHLAEAAAEQQEAAWTWDTSAISEHELNAVRQFLERRGQIQPHARVHLAQELAGKLRPKVPGAERVADAEEFLELLAAVKSRRRY